MDITTGAIATNQLLMKLVKQLHLQNEQLEAQNAQIEARNAE